MNKTNFYSQPQFGAHFTGNFDLPADFFARLPKGPASPNLTARDAFLSHSGSAFEQKLRQEMDKIQTMEDALNHKIFSAKDNEMSAGLRQEIMKERTIIARAKKMMALLVDQMQKSMQNIAANFR